MDAALARTAGLYPGRHAPSPGRLYGWGKVGGKAGSAMPVPASAVDKAGDCIYPAPLQLPKGTGAVFLKASVDVGPMCALDSAGGVWAWSGWASESWPAKPARVLEGCVDCAAGSGFVVAAKADGTVWLLGKAPSPTPLPSTGGGTGWVELPWAGEPAHAVAVDACGGVVLAASAEGALFSCGRGVTLGLAEEHGLASFTLVPGLPPVGAFSVGSIHAACAGRDGSLYTWGDGLSGTLGTFSAQYIQIQNFQFITVDLLNKVTFILSINLQI